MELHAAPPPPPRPPQSKRLGGVMSLAMVVGTIIGSGIYVLPATVAPYGWNIVIAFAVTIAGTVCLALSMARLARRLPGGPYSYITVAFGDTAAFVTMWTYLVSQWTGIAAVAIAAGGALGYVFPAVGSGVPLAVVAIVSIIALTLVNMSGARSAGFVQVAATLIKIVPLLLVVLLVLLRLGSGQALEPLSSAPISLAGITAAAALMLFAFTGFESAAVSANVTDHDTDVVPSATINGTVFVAAIYLTATLAVLFLLPSVVAGASGAPFADATAPVLGTVAGAFVAIVAAISALGAGNALILLSAEVARAIANAGDLPPAFARTNRAGVSPVSLIAGAVVAILLVLASISDSFVAVFTFVALISAVSALVLYLVCALAALKLKAEKPLLAGIAILYAIAMFIGAGLEATLWGLALAAAGLPVRWLSRRFSSAATSPAAATVPAAPRE
ncbi:APC family permease [Sphingomonas sp.]|uniref:APC family permease n=1 Tax=Sphingomonas sp. TaxID=28214 RepID=UPI0025E5DF4D|nr:amino acid permease [Sphingomonas sp.]